MKRLFDNNFHDCKVIPLFLIKKNFGENLKFHNNVGSIINEVFGTYLFLNFFIFKQKSLKQLFLFEKD